jgi:predicted dinucleotide-binding enzyme
LGTLGAASLANSANQQPDAAVLFYATDDTNINFSVEQLILDNGFAPVRVGGLDQSIRIEVLAICMSLVHWKNRYNGRSKK